MAKYRLTEPHYRDGHMFKVDDVIDFTPRMFTVERDGKKVQVEEKPGTSWVRVEDAPPAKPAEKTVEKPKQ